MRLRAGAWNFVRLRMPTSTAATPSIVRPSPAVNPSTFTGIVSPSPDLILVSPGSETLSVRAD